MRYELICPSGVYAVGRRLHCGNRIWSWTPRAWSWRSAPPAHTAAAGGGEHGATDRVNFLFADARPLYDDAIEMLDQGKVRNAAEKVWGATKRATGALVLAREGREPQSAGQARRALLQMGAGDPRVGTLQGQYHLRARMLHIDCFEGNCEPEQEMVDLVRATISYIQDAEGLASWG